METMTGVDEDNNNKILSRDKAPSPMMTSGEYGRYHDNGRRSSPKEHDISSDAIEVFECRHCTFATTKASDLKAHQIKHRFGSKQLLDDIYRSPRQAGHRDPREIESDFEIMKQSYLSQNGGRQYSIGNEDEEDNRLVIDENTPKPITSVTSVTNSTIQRPVPVYSSSQSLSLHQRAKPGPKPGTTGTAARPRTGCAPVREAVDPAKYISIQEPDGIKYACSKCGNIYKWRKSLNKHWKEKHDGELPDPRPNLTSLNIPRLGKGYVTGLPNGKGNVISFMGPQQQQRLPGPARNKPITSQHGLPLMSGGDMSMNSKEIRKVLKRPAMMENFSPISSPSMVKFSPPSNMQSLLQTQKMSRISMETSMPTYMPSISPVASYRSPDKFSPMHNPIPSHRTTPVDLSKQPINFSEMRKPKPAHGEGILDLSKKIPGRYAPYNSLTDNVQDEPLDFSMKNIPQKPKAEPEHFSYVQEEIGSLMSLQCPSCAYSAQDKQEYDNHMELHLRKQHYKCAECQDVFSTMDILNSHFVNVHADNHLIKHKLNGLTGDDLLKQSNTAESTQLYKYLTMDSQNQLKSCMICGAIFQWQWTLAKHFDQDHHVLPNPYRRKPTNSASATQASASPQISDDEVKPENGDDQGELIQCSQCPFQSSSSSELTRHQIKHSISRHYICRICSFITKWKDQLISHYKQDHPTANIDLSTISSHTVAGPVALDRPETPPNVKPYDLTDEETTIVYPQAPEDTEFNENDSNSSRGSRRRGNESPGSATTDAMLPFKCTVCEYRARWPSEITQHMKNHSDQKPYHCPRCSYRSKWKWDVVKHLKRCGGGTVNDVIDTTKYPKSHHVQALVNDGSPILGHSKGMSLLQQRELLSNGPPNVTVVPSSKSSDGMNDSEYPVYMSDDSRSPNSEQGPVSESGRVSPSSEPNSQGYHVCLHCPFVGNSPAELKRHSRVHSDEKPFICKTCGYCSKWKCDLKKHLRTYKHTSAVPLTYGGHGRKPADWGDQKRSEGEGNTTDPEYVDGEKPQDDETDMKQQPPLYKCSSFKCQYVTYKKNAMDSHMKIHRTNTMKKDVGKLKCKQCDFEAEDLPSFLQHKLVHSQSEGKSESPLPIDMESMKTEVPVTKHRRKAAKQIRITRTEADDMDAADEDEDQGMNREIGRTQLDMENNSAVNISQKKYPCEWCIMSFERLNMLYQHAEIAHPRELNLQEKHALQHKVIERQLLELKNDADDLNEMKYESDEDETPITRRLSWTKRQDMSNIEKRRLEVRLESHGAEEDIPPELRSKRRRRLKTCQKCGYITDNVTTLQRHMAKHGSNGKYTCEFCDYSVDRQHIVEYHIKIVHHNGINAVENGDNVHGEGVMDDGAHDDEMRDMEEEIENMDSNDDGDFNENGIWEITKIKGQEMKVQRVGRKTSYHCLKCPFYTCNITNAVNHFKQHGANKKYTCELCDYSLDQLRHVMHHMIKVHGHNTDIMPSDNCDKVDDAHIDTVTEVLPMNMDCQPVEKLKIKLPDTAILRSRKLGGVTKYPCRYCPFVACGGRSLKQHIKRHKNSHAKSKCKYCDYQSTTVKLLLVHEKNNHK